MKVSKQSRRLAKELFRECLKEGSLNEARVREQVDAVIAAKPRGYMGILAHFQRLVKLEVDRRTARVETAVLLEGPLQTEIRDSVARAHGPGLTFSFAQNPALIGGIRIRVGSDIYDGSVQGRLAALQASF